MQTYKLAVKKRGGVISLVVVMLGLSACKASQDQSQLADIDDQGPEHQIHSSWGPGDFRWHVPRRELELSKEEVTGVGAQAGFSADIGVAEMGAKIRYEFKTQVKTRLSVIFAFHKKDSVILKNIDGHAVFNFDEDPRDRFVGECEMVTGLTHALREDAFLYVLGSGADASRDDVWLTSVTRIQDFFINKGDTPELLKSQCMTIYREKHEQSVRKELKLWAETALGARPALNLIQLHNKTGAAIWVREPGSEKEVEIPAWGRRAFAKGYHQGHRVRYGNTCYAWTPDELKTYEAVLVPLGGQGCQFNWHAGCLDVVGDTAPPVEHTTGC